MMKASGAFVRLQEIFMAKQESQAPELDSLVVSPDAKNATYAKDCAHCGTSFPAQRSTAKYCGANCRVAAAKSSPAHVRYKEKQKRRRYLRHLDYTHDKMAQ